MIQKRHTHVLYIQFFVFSLLEHWTAKKIPFSLSMNKLFFHIFFNCNSTIYWLILVTFLFVWTSKLILVWKQFTCMDKKKKWNIKMLPPYLVIILLAQHLSQFIAQYFFFCTNSYFIQKKKKNIFYNLLFLFK